MVGGITRVFNKINKKTRLYQTNQQILRRDQNVTDMPIFHPITRKKHITESLEKH